MKDYVYRVALNCLLVATCFTTSLIAHQSSAAGISLSGTVAYINDPDNHLTNDLGLTSLSLGQMFTADYDFTSTSVPFSGPFSVGDPAVALYVINNPASVMNDPGFSMSLYIAGSGAGAFADGSTDYFLLGDNTPTTSIFPYYAGNDYYGVTSLFFNGAGYDLYLNIFLLDSSQTKISNLNFAYVEDSLAGWEPHFAIYKTSGGVVEYLVSSYDYGSSGPTDSDNDGIPDGSDNCPSISNPSQSDQDNDGIGDACDTDADNDGVADGSDNCPNDFNPGQSDQDNDGIGDACDTDADNDGVADGSDNCPNDFNPGQSDQDNDGIGDACDTDADNDGVEDGSDNCPGTPFGSTVDANGCSQSQVDEDGDGVCDPGESSTLCMGSDNCPVDANPGQVDNDYDDLGNVCDTCPNDPGSCDVFAGVIFDKAEVKFDYGKVKIYGNLTVPPGYWTDNLNPTGSVQILVSDVEISNQATGFEVKGSDDKKWEFESADDFEYGVKKFKVDFKGAKYDYHHPNGVKLKAQFIGGEETNMEIEVKEENWPITIMIADQTISYDASGNITTSVPYELYKEGDTSKAFFALPIQLLAGDTILIGSDPVYVGDDYKEGTVKFKLETRFDTSQPPYADAVDKTLDLNVSLGGALFAIGTIDTADWDEIKNDKWKK